MLGAEQAVLAADKIYKKHKTRNANELAELLGITVYECPFVNQKGVYKIIERNPYVYIKETLEPQLRNIVLLHEIGHHVLHRKEATILNGFQEINIFDMHKNKMEYEANVFAAQISLSDADVLEYVMQGYSIDEIAAKMESDVNLVALKVDILSKKGYDLRMVESRSDFLK